MRELIYLDDETGEAYAEVKALLLKEFPFAEIEDASDYIHEYRFEFVAPVAEGTFYRFAIREGFARNCLGFELQLLDREKFGLVKKWLEQVKSRKEAKSG